MDEERRHDSNATTGNNYPTTFRAVMGFGLLAYIFSFIGARWQLRAASVVITVLLSGLPVAYAFADLTVAPETLLVGKEPTAYSFIITNNSANSNSIAHRCAGYIRRPDSFSGMSPRLDASS